MHIDYAKGCYWAHEVGKEPGPSHNDMQAAKWRWIKTANAWMTSEPLKALAYKAFATGEAAVRLEGLFQERQAALAASCALTSDIEVPAPEGCVYRPYQLAGIEYTLGKNAVLLADDMRLGKYQPTDCSVLTPQGWREIGAIAPGDFVIGSAGLPIRVKGVSAVQADDEYELETMSGAKTRCGPEHLWSFVTSKGNLKTVTAKYMVDKGLFYPGHATRRCRFQLPTVNPIVGMAQPLPVDPYLLGMLIGDGALTVSSVVLSCPPHKDKLLEYATAWAHSNGFTVTRHQRLDDACPQYALVQKYKKGNDLLDTIRALGLNCKSPARFIPPAYLITDYNSRLALLRGLMDTDGSFSNSRCVFSTSSKLLAKDVCELVRSLGGVASLRVYNYPGRGEEYHVRISLPVSPFMFQHKEWHKSGRVKGTGIVRLEKTGRRVPMVCLSVDAADGLYVTDDYILTHNTIQAIGVANTFEAPEKILIICPSTPKRNWERELRKWLVHTDLEIGVCDGKKNPKTPVLIINYDILHTHKAYLDSVNWDMIVCDESHYLKNAKARRTKMVLGAAGRGKKVERLKTDFWLFMSGSQMFKTPVDLFTVLQVCDPEGLGKSWWDFVHHYCDAKSDGFGLDTSGASNLEELQYLMRTRFMCRRTKKDVAGDMPSNRQTISLPRSGLVDKLVKQEKAEVEKNFGAFSALIGGVMSAEAIDELLTEYSYLDGIERGDDNNVTLVGELAKIRRELAVAKTPMCIDFINDVLEHEDKVVVFAHHRDVITLLKEAFPDAAVVRGGMADKVKDAEVTRFQTDPACRVLIGNIVAAGQAINLSVADVAVFIEISWVPSEVSQAEERIWDVLKTRPNTIYRLPVEGSLDEAMIAVVEQRQEDVNKAMNMDALR